MKTTPKKATRPKARPSNAFRGVNSRIEAGQKFIDTPSTKGSLTDVMLATLPALARDFMPPVKTRTTSYTDDSREYVKKRAGKSRELLDKIYSSSTTKKAEGGKVTGYKDGGCVMSGRGSKYKGSM